MKSTQNTTIYSLIGNMVSADIYLFRENKLTRLSNNTAYHTQAIATEVVKLSLKNTLTLIESNRFYNIVIPIDGQTQMIVVPHLDSTRLPLDYHLVSHFFNNIDNLSALLYLIFTQKKAPKWSIHVQSIKHTTKAPKTLSKVALKKLYHNEVTLFQAAKAFDIKAFKTALEETTFTAYMGSVFEKNGYVRGQKDLLIRFISLMTNYVIDSGQLPVESALKLEDELIGTLEFKKTVLPFKLWLHHLALEYFRGAIKRRQHAHLSLPQQCKSYIKNHVNQKITIAKLAEELNCSVSSLSHAFKREYGITINAAVQAQKMEAAKFLLAHTSIRISEIAYVLAFSHSNYFMRSFKKATGITAGLYRTQEKQKIDQAKSNHH